MRLCTPEILNAALDSQQVSNACQEISRRLAEVKEGTLTREAFEAEKSRIKTDFLPVVCFHASFTDGYRHNQSAVPSGLSIYDVDHLEGAPRAWYAEKVAGREAELGISLAHVSPSGEGIRLVFDVPDGLTLAQAQQWMASQLGDDTYDGCVKDLARCSFVVCRDYLLYYDEEALFADREVSMPLSAAPVAPSAPSVPSQPASAAPARNGEPFDDCFEGIPYTEIVTALEEQLGCAPARSARNNFIFSMACNLRYICNDDPLWMAHVMPRYGEEEAKFMSTVRSACNRPQNQDLPGPIARALELVRRRREMENLKQAHGVGTPEPPKMPERLTAFMRLITDKVPDNLKPTVAMSVFPSLGVHCQNVTFRYNDNAIVEPTFMNVLVAEMSSGKSCINEPINAIMDDIKKRDTRNRKLLQDYKERYDICPANEQRPERPKGLAVQWVKSDMTPAAFVQLMADAGGKFLYSRMDEIGMLNQLKTNGKGNNVTEILRLAYDRGEYGQERVGAKSVSECVEVRWNWNASTTPGKCRKFFGDSMLDGTLSRITFCTIRSDDDRMPVYGNYTEKYREQVQNLVKPLCDFRGLITCNKANQLVRAMLDENSQYATLADDEAYRELSYRAVLSAFKRGMILYMLNRRKWSHEIEDFVRWSFHYDMWCKMWIFGEKMRHAIELDKAVLKPGPRNLLELLTDTFTYEDFQSMRRAQGREGDGRNTLNKWISRGYCSYDPYTQLYTKSASFLNRPQPDAA